jgi:hypothetical protein
MMRTKMTTTAKMTTADKPRPFVREDPAVRRENLLKVVERLRRGWKQRLNKQANPPWQEWELELVKPVALRLRAREIKISAAVALLQPLLSHRKENGLRKKISNWAAHGKFL